MATNYYVILGIDAGATQHDIKKAYRRKAKQYHPDKYGQDAAPFKAVQEAFAVLGNPSRRRDYDSSLQLSPTKRPARVRPEPIQRRHSQAEPLIPTKRPAELEDISLTSSFDTIRPSFEELFDRIWSNFTGETSSKAEGIQGLTIEVPVPWEDAQTGGRARVMVPAHVVCPTCGGLGGVGLFECFDCRGTGSLVGEFPLAVEFPPKMPDNYAVQLSLDRLGIHNLYLVVRFRVI